MHLRMLVQVQSVSVLGEYSTSGSHLHSLVPSAVSRNNIRWRCRSYLPFSKSITSDFGVSSCDPFAILEHSPYASDLW